MHKTLRATPAMEAGLCEHVWNIEEIARLIPEPVAKNVALKSKSHLTFGEDMLLILTFDLHKPYINGQPHKRVTKRLKDIGFDKATIKKGVPLPNNTYIMKLDAEYSDDGNKKIRNKYHRKIKKILKEEHQGESTVFLFVGAYWASRIGHISN